jgi:hypothetical protein
MHIEERVLITGGAAFSAPICASALWRLKPSSSESTISLPVRAATSSPCSIADILK